MKGSLTPPSDERLIFLELLAYSTRSYYKDTFQRGKQDQAQEIRELLGEDETNISNKFI
jgi:hypothetical protein